MPKKNPLLTKPRTETIQILDGAAEAEVRELDEKLSDLYAAEQDPANKRMSTNPQKATDEAAAALDKRLQEIYDAAPKLELREPSHGEILASRRDNPPEDGDRVGELAGVDENGFMHDLVRTVMVEPDVTDDQFDEFWDQLSEYNYRTIKRTFDRFALEGPSIPKSSAVSGIAEMRRDDSKRRTTGE